MSNQTPHQPSQSAITPTASSLSQAAHAAVSTALAFTGTASTAQSILTSLNNVASPSYRGANRPTWQKRSCCCSHPKLCKELMWEWSKLGTDYSHMLDYMTLPALKVGEKITPQNEHSNGYHTLCVLHLHGHDTKIREEFASVNDRLFIAPHHFKPCLRAALARSTQEKSNLKKYRCSMQEAKDALLTAADVCKIRGKGDTDPKVYYYLAPNNNNFDDIKHELAEAKAKARMELDAVNTSSKKKKLGSDTTSAPGTSRQVHSTSPTTEEAKSKVQSTSC